MRGRLSSTCASVKNPSFSEHENSARRTKKPPKSRTIRVSGWWLKRSATMRSACGFRVFLVSYGRKRIHAYLCCTNVRLSRAYDEATNTRKLVRLRLHSRAPAEQVVPVMSLRTHKISASSIGFNGLTVYLSLARAKISSFITSHIRVAYTFYTPRPLSRFLLCRTRLYDATTTTTVITTTTKYVV
jgi:hypothetical protein